tara:strand:- start:6596 stop:7219 length:624 start_codon:yes stop_codon:yes gene_type:complete
MSVQQSQLNKSRLDKFLCVINLPEGLRGINDNSIGSTANNKINENSLQFSVYGAVVPDVTVPDVILPYAGQSYKISSNTRPPYANVTVSFTVDSKFNNYWVIYKWLDLLNDDKASVFDGSNITNTPKVDSSSRASDTRRNRSSTPPELYQSLITIYGMDEFDKPVVQFDYTKAFPVSLGGINYNYRESGEIEIEFEFAFSQLLVKLP